jgi:hypothetical protein
MISRPIAVPRDGVEDTSTAGTAAADAPPASDIETPTSPNAGTTSFRRVRFEARFVSGIVRSPMPFANMAAQNTIYFACAACKPDRRSSLRMVGAQDTR